MNSTDRIECVRSYMLQEASAASPLQVIVDLDGAKPRIAASAATDDDDQRWAALKASNPRVHDAPILAVSGNNSASNTLSCRIDSYKRLAIQEFKRSLSDPDPFNPAGIWLLGVKGWIIAKDRAGHQHVLIARRGADTRIYGLMWESAPAGGVAPPHPDSKSETVRITDDMLRQSLASECGEELGLDLDWSAARIIALTQDSIARSYDIHLRLDLPTTINPHHSPVCPTGQRSWEYVDTAWLAQRDAVEFDSKSADAITPPTRAMLRAIGWIETI